MELQFNHYALADPRIEDPIRRVRYIGRTTQTLRLRYKGHRKSVREGGKTHRDCWMRQVMTAGFEPIIIDLGTGGEGREQELIIHWRGLGADLTNRTAGGIGGQGYRWTDEQRANRVKVAREVAARPGWKEKVRERTLAALLTPEVQQRVRDGVRRHYEKPGALERKQEQQRAVMSRPEVQAKLHSPENRQKAMDGHKKWLEDPANRATLSERMREQQARPEVKAESSRRMRELRAQPEVKAAYSQRTSEMNARPEIKAKSAERFREMNNRPEKREANIRRCHEMTADPVLVAKRVASHGATYKARRAVDPDTLRTVAMVKAGLSQAEMARQLGLRTGTLGARLRKLKEDGIL